MASNESVGEWVDISVLIENPRNPRVNDKAVESVAKSIKRFGFSSPIIARRANNMIIAGHTRYKASIKLGLSTVPVRYLDLDPADADLLMIADNKIGEKADWNNDLLSEILTEINGYGLELDALGFTDEELSNLIDSLDVLDNNDQEKFGDSSGIITKTFGAPPFSILDSRQGYWRERKRFWLSFEIESYLGRDAFDDKSTVASKSLDAVLGIKYKGGGSVFDPVLCELLYSWFNIPSGSILDSFAGGSVRGLIASALNYKYIGYELRAEQVDANIAQYKKIGLSNGWKIEPKYITGDSSVKIAETDEKVDMIFTCPPYAFLEVYSDHKEDLSNMPYDKFLEVYRKIIKDSCERLKENRFAIFIVGEVRSKKDGSYISFVPDTIKAFTDIGMKFYNEIIYITNVGTVALSAPKAFRSGRKAGKVHQNILVFYKGDTSKANSIWKDIDINIMDIEEEDLDE